jgi:hypothetical protein
MSSKMDVRDIMITDMIFRSLRDKLAIACGWIKPQLKTLQSWQAQETKELSQQQGISNSITLIFRTL